MFDIEEEGRIRLEELENALRIAKMNPTTSDIEQIKNQLGNTGKQIKTHFSNDNRVQEKNRIDT